MGAPPDISSRCRLNHPIVTHLNAGQLGPTGLSERLGSLGSYLVAALITLLILSSILLRHFHCAFDRCIIPVLPVWLLSK